MPGYRHRRDGLFVAGAVSVAGLLLGSCAGPETADEAVARAAAALTVAPPVSAFVVLARHGASIGDRSALSGANVGVAAGAAGAQNAYTAGFDTHTAVGFDTIAQRITLRDRAVTGNLDATVVVRGAGAVTGTLSPFLAPPTAPQPTAAVPGAANINVASGAVATIAAGSFNNVVVSGTLNLSGGLYQLRNVIVNPDGRIVALARTVIRIATGVSTGDRAHILPAAGLHASDLVIEANGTVVNTDGVSLGNDVQLTALVVANRGFRCSDRLIASGAIAAQDVNVGQDVHLTFDGGFACATNADCGGGSGSCAATCVDTQCVRPPRCSAVQVSANSDHACATMADGTASCWGDNGPGDLGHNNFTQKDAPGPVLVLNADSTTTPLAGVRAVAVSQSSSCAVMTDGTATCWGFVPTGAPGGLSPTAVPIPGVSGAVGIAAGGGLFCALLGGGDAICWTGSQPPMAPLGISGATALTVGGAYSCALITGGTVKCWGTEDAGQFGDQGVGVTVDPTAAVTVPGLTSAVAVSAAGSGHHVCAVRANGDVLCWGRNDAGEIGDGTTPAGQIVGPTTVLAGAVAVGAGMTQHTCAALAGGSVECWGANGFGQLGDGTFNNANAPSASRAAIGVTGAIQTSGGTNFSCAVQRDGQAFCWGDNADATLGNAPGQQPPSATPLAVQF